MRAVVERVLGPSVGRPSGFSQPDLHPTADVVALTAEVWPALEGTPTPHVVVVDGTSTDVRGKGWLPRWSPDGSRLAHADEGGLRVDGAAVPLAGGVERLAWSPDGSRLLAVVAAPGSEVSGADGSGLVPHRDEPWLPHVLSSTDFPAWRRLVVVDATSLLATPVGRADLNIWDACWAGPGAVVAVCSDGSSAESAWYSADVRRIDVTTGEDQVIVRPTWHLGPLSASPTGHRLAWVEAVCSDRDIAAGRVHLLDLATGADRVLDVGADVSCVQLLDDDTVGFVGVRNLTTVIGRATAEGAVTVLWESDAETVPGFSPVASFTGDGAAFVRGGFRRAPEVCVVRDGSPTVLYSCATPGTEIVTGRTWTSEHRRWRGRDGWEIDGWLHLPDRPGPHPLVVTVHGGPVLSYRSLWAFPGLLPLLLGAGYAVLQPNPRGSSGKGLDFAAAVVGDMGGEDAHDILTGVQALVDEGVADPVRVGVTGGSYGGYMSAWLVTQTDAFAAAVAVHPITDWRMQHGGSNLSAWDELFLDGKPYAADGLYRERSPMTHVDRVSTPTLFITGRLDRATPPDQTVAMHRALVDLGVRSDCVVHQQAGHGARDLSARIDDLARTLDWFTTWMPAMREDGPR